MKNQKVVIFTNKDLVATLAIIILAIIICLFQVTLMWLTNLQFSLQLIDYRSIGLANLKMISTFIISFQVIFLLAITYKVFKIKFKKMFLKNDFLFLIALVIVFIIAFLIPNRIPINFTMPIILLFTYVIYKFRF